MKPKTNLNPNPNQTDFLKLARRVTLSFQVDNIAMFEMENGGGGEVTCIFFDAALVSSKIEDEGGGGDWFWESLLDSVVGFLNLVPESRFALYEINSLAATGGRGPMISDVALSYAHEKGWNGIMPDRKKVSEGAEKLMSYYYHRRQNEVGNDKLPPSLRTHGDSAVLDSYYFTRSPMDLSGMRRRYQEMVNFLLNKLDDLRADELRMHLWEVGELFWDQMYY